MADSVLPISDKIGDCEAWAECIYTGYLLQLSTYLHFPNHFPYKGLGSQCYRKSQVPADRNRY